MTTPGADDDRDETATQADIEVPPRPAAPHEEPNAGETALADLAKAAEATWKRARRWFIFVVGVSIVLFGLIVGILPGVPGIPIMILGFALLATEFVWARKILNRLKKEAMALKARAERAIGLGGSSTTTSPAPSQAVEHGQGADRHVESRNEERGAA